MQWQILVQKSGRAEVNYHQILSTTLRNFNFINNMLDCDVVQVFYPVP